MQSTKPSAGVTEHDVYMAMFNQHRLSTEPSFIHFSIFHSLENFIKCLIEAKGFAGYQVDSGVRSGGRLLA